MSNVMGIYFRLETLRPLGSVVDFCFRSRATVTVLFFSSPAFLFIFCSMANIYKGKMQESNLINGDYEGLFKNKEN